MIVRFLLLTGLAASVVVVPTLVAQQPAAAQQEPTFRAGTRTVPIYASVTDDIGRFVTDLRREDFEVRDEGKVQPITLFTTDLQPLTAVVLLDGSRSMVKALDTVITAADHFVVRLIPGDRARVGSFSDEIRFAPAFTGDRDQLAREVNDLFDLRIGPGTRLWDAIGQATASFEGTEGRRVVIVFTDGDDTSSTSTFEEALSRARHADVMVYLVLIRGMERLPEERRSPRRTRLQDVADLVACQRRRVLPRRQRARRHELHRDRDRRGVAQPVRAGFCAADVGRQAAQDRRPGETPAAQDPRAAVLYRGGIRSGSMIRAAWRGAALICGIAAAVATIGAQQAYRSRTDLVSVYATVMDSTGRLVPDLTKDDFEVRDNGKVQALNYFSNDIQPITIIVMLDRSGSMEENFPLVEQASELFVRKLLPADRARIGNFSRQIVISPHDFTSDQELLLRRAAQRDAECRPIARVDGRRSKHHGPAS